MKSGRDYEHKNNKYNREDGTDKKREDRTMQKGEEEYGPA